MSFLNTWGLLGLIAIPILIIIYIIKNKYTEQVISATYLWTLSERFLKKKNPIKKLTGIISLILQILAVILISLALARPQFALPNQANDYLFIIDASGSMNITQDGKTRFDLGKDRIEEIIDDSVNGSTYSLISVGDTTDLLFGSIGSDKNNKPLSDKRQALSILETAEVSYGVNSMTEAMSKAQQAFSSNSALKVYLVTDKSYTVHNNVELINLSNNEQNYAIGALTCEKQANSITVYGKLYSYESDARLNLSLYVNGSETAVDTLSGVSVAKFDGTNATDFSFTYSISDYYSVRVVIDNVDALSIDNEAVIYNEKSDQAYETVIVSDTSAFFLQQAIASLGNLNVKVMKTQEFEDAQDDREYGLYVFNGYTPDVLPRNSAVWFINPTDTLDNTGFSISDKVTFGNPDKDDVVEGTKLNTGDVVYNNTTASTVTALLENTRGDSIKVAYYVTCDLTRDFRELMYCNNNPVLFAGTNGYGNRQVVFAFDILDSNISTVYDFPVLIYNLLNYTFPKVVDSTSYYCGDTVKVNVLANCDSIRVDTPAGKVVYLDTETDVAEFDIDEVGVFTVTLTSGTSQSQINLYGSLPEEERVITVTENEFSVSGQPTQSTLDGIFDDLMILFIILAAIFVADWMVYCYEQYQLR